MTGERITITLKCQRCRRHFSAARRSRKTCSDACRAALYRRRRRKSVHFRSKRHDWGTPQWLFDQLDAEFRFTLDVCATESNAKCERFFTPRDDGLSQPWQGACWMNPPYGASIGRWMHKALDESRKGATVVCLVPARTDTAWWHACAVHGEIRYIQGRLRFDGAESSAPFPSAVIVFRAARLARIAS